MSENILPTEHEHYRAYVEATEEAAQRVKREQWLYERSCTPSLRIIPSDDVPSGQRRTVGMDIFVSPTNYAWLRTMEVNPMLVALGCLKEELSRRNSS